MKNALLQLYYDCSGMLVYLLEFECPLPCKRMQKRFQSRGVKLLAFLRCRTLVILRSKYVAIIIIIIIEKQDS